MCSLKTRHLVGQRTRHGMAQCAHPNTDLTAHICDPRRWARAPKWCPTLQGYFAHWVVLSLSSPFGLPPHDNRPTSLLLGQGIHLLRIRDIGAFCSKCALGFPSDMFLVVSKTDTADSWNLLHVQFDLSSTQVDVPPGPTSAQVDTLMPSLPRSLSSFAMSFNLPHTFPLSPSHSLYYFAGSLPHCFELLKRPQGAARGQLL